MKNYGDLGACYPPRPTAATDNTLPLDLHNKILSLNRYLLNNYCPSTKTFELRQRLLWSCHHLSQENSFYHKYNKKVNWVAYQKPFFKPPPLEDNRELKQRRFWATHVNRKWGLFPFYTPGHYQICIAEFLFSHKDDLPEGFNQTTAQRCKKSTSGWRPSLKNAVA